LLERPALQARLDEAFGKRLTLVIAGAGFGKSTLLGQWASDEAGRPALRDHRKATESRRGRMASMETFVVQVFVPALAATSPSGKEDQCVG
jgi:hypothetical protein